MIYRFLIALLWSQRRVVLWLIAIGIVTVAVFYIKRNDLHIYMDSYHTRNKLREEVDQLQAEAKALQKEREDLTKGGFQIEKVARERFRLSRPGEIVVYLDSPKTAGSSETLKKTMNDGR